MRTTCPSIGPTSTWVSMTSRRGRRTGRASRGSCFAPGDSVRIRAKLDTSVAAVRSPLGHAAVPVPGRGARGLSHGGRERGRQSGPGERDPADRSRTRVRSHTNAIKEARGEPHWFQIYTVPDWNVNKTAHRQGVGCGLPCRWSGPSICWAGAIGNSRDDPKAARTTTGRFVRIATTTSRATRGRCVPGWEGPPDLVRRTRGTTSSASRIPRPMKVDPQGHRHARGGGAGG